MYHDEFAKKAAKPSPNGEELLPSLPLEVGGGISLGLAASLNLPISLLVFGLGGLLPLLACCLSIAAHRATEFLAVLLPGQPTRTPTAAPVHHHLSAATGPMAGTRLLRQRARSAR